MIFRRRVRVVPRPPIPQCVNSLRPTCDFKSQRPAYELRGSPIASQQRHKPACDDDNLGYRAVLVDFLSSP